MAADIATTSNMECAIKKKKGKGKITKLQYVRARRPVVGVSYYCRICAIVVTLCMITSALFINTKMLASSNERASAGAGIRVLSMTLVVADSAYASNRDTWHCALAVLMV
jgi:hypothetical protein